MKERFKTILLFFLTAMSIFLTQKLWIELPKNMVDAITIDREITSSYSLADMIVPNKFFLNFGNMNHTLLHDDSSYTIWDNSRHILAQVLGSDELTIEEISKDKYLKFQEERSIVFYFPEEISTYILAKTWNVKNPNSITDTIPNVNSIYIYLGSGNPFFVFSDEEKYVLVYDAQVDISLINKEFKEIEEAKDYDYYYSMREVYGINNDIYIPYKMEGDFPTVYVSNDITSLEKDEKDHVAEEFFSTSIDYIRDIVEGNGSTIYIFNDRVLKLNVNGTLEYFHALEERVAERNLYRSLSTLADFITEKISSQNRMYLSSIEEIEFDNNLGYRVTFKYRIRGIPLTLGNRELGDYMEFEVFNNHIRSYKFLARSEMDIGLNTDLNRKSLLSSYDVLDKNYDFLERKYLEYTKKTKEELGEGVVQMVLGDVSDISLSYYDPNLKDTSELLILVWTLRLNNRIYAFNAYTGNLVFER